MTAKVLQEPPASLLTHHVIALCSHFVPRGLRENASRYSGAGRTWPCCPAACVVLVGEIKAPIQGTPKASCMSCEAGCTPGQSFPAQLGQHQHISLEQQDNFCCWSGSVAVCLPETNPSDFPAGQQKPREKGALNCFYIHRPAERAQDRRAAESTSCSSRIFTPQSSVEVFSPAFIAWETS